eukprot:scaffold146847_cov34-Prasinocladus_malaysianus.AAC.1
MCVVFLSSSHCHEAIEIDGVNQVNAFKKWYEQEGSDNYIWLSEKCNVDYEGPECPEKNG